MNSPVSRMQGWSDTRYIEELERMLRELLGERAQTRAAVAQVRQIVGAPLDSYPADDKSFYRFWYGHMLNDLMQPPLADVNHATARYIWNAARGLAAPHAASADCWCQPEVDSVDPDTGATVYVHRQKQ